MEKKNDIILVRIEQMAARLITVTLTVYGVAALSAIFNVARVV